MRAFATAFSGVFALAALGVGVVAVRSFFAVDVWVVGGYWLKVNRCKVRITAVADGEHARVLAELPLHLCALVLLGLAAGALWLSVRVPDYERVGRDGE